MISDNERHQLLMEKSDEALLSAYRAGYLSEATRSAIAQELHRRGVELPTVAGTTRALTDNDTQDLTGASAQARNVANVRLGGIGRMPHAHADRPWYLALLCALNILVDLGLLVWILVMMNDDRLRLTDAGRTTFTVLAAATVVDTAFKACLFGGLAIARIAYFWVAPLDIFIGIVRGATPSTVIRVFVYLVWVFVLTRKRVVAFFDSRR